MNIYGWITLFLIGSFGVGVCIALRRHDVGLFGSEMGAAICSSIALVIVFLFPVTMGAICINQQYWFKKTIRIGEKTLNIPDELCISFWEEGKYVVYQSNHSYPEHLKVGISKLIGREASVRPSIISLSHVRLNEIGDIQSLLVNEQNTSRWNEQDIGIMESISKQKYEVSRLDGPLCYPIGCKYFKSRWLGDIENNERFSFSVSGSNGGREKENKSIDIIAYYFRNNIEMLVYLDFDKQESIQDYLENADRAREEMIDLFDVIHKSK